MRVLPGLVLMFCCLPAAIAQKDLVRRLASASPDERRAAVTAIAALGPAAQPVVPDLVARCADPDLDVVVAVVAACDRLAELTTPVLERQVELGEGQMLLALAAALGRASKRVSATRAPILHEQVSAAIASEDPRLRLLAARAIGTLPDPGSAQLAGLLRVVGEQDTIAARPAREALTRHCESLLPALRAALSQHPELLCERVAECIPGDTDGQLELLASFLGCDQAGVQATAIVRLGRQGERAFELAESVRAAVRSKHANVRGAAIDACAAISPDEDWVAEVLGEGIRDDVLQVVTTTVRELRYRRIRLAAWTPRLVALLEQDQVRDAAIQALYSDPHADRQALQRSLTGSNLVARIAATEILAWRAQTEAEDLRDVPGWLQSKDGSVRRAALRLVLALRGRVESLREPVQQMIRGAEAADAIAALATFGTGADAVGAKIVATLKDQDAKVRQAAANALPRLMPGKSTAMAALMRGIKDEETGWVCANALGTMGDEAAPLADDLLRLLRQPDLVHRDSVIGALGDIGSTTDATLQGLVEVSRGKYHDRDRPAALQALHSLRANEMQRANGKPSAPRWKRVLTAFLDATQSPEVDLRNCAYRGLATWPEDEKVLALLRSKLVEDPDASSAVLGGLQAFASRLSAAELDRVAQFVVQGSASGRWAAIRVLGAGGAAGHSRLWEIARGADLRVREAILQHLEYLGEGDHRQALLPLLALSAEHARQQVAWHFAQQPESTEIQQRLLTAWRSAGGDPKLRRTLAGIVAMSHRYGRQVPKDRDELVQSVLADDDPFVQFLVVQAGLAR